MFKRPTQGALLALSKSQHCQNWHDGRSLCSNDYDDDDNDHDDYDYDENNENDDDHDDNHCMQVDGGWGVATVPSFGFTPG